MPFSDLPVKDHNQCTQSSNPDQALFSPVPEYHLKLSKIVLRSLQFKHHCISSVYAVQYLLQSYLDCEK